MREHLEATNHQDAIAYVNDLVENNQSINERVIQHIHNLILRGINKKYAGTYRNVQVLIKGSKHKPPQAYFIKKRMEDLLFRYDENKTLLHPVILATEMHQKLVTIHPYIDGNGRTSRLLMNLILLKNGFVIANIKGSSKSRLSYYEALEKSQISKNSTDDFVIFVSIEELNSLKNYIQILS